MLIKFSYYCHVGDSNLYFGNHQKNTLHPNEELSIHTPGQLLHDLLEHPRKHTKQNAIGYLDEIQALGGAGYVRSIDSESFLLYDLPPLLEGMTHKHYQKLINSTWLDKYYKLFMEDPNCHLWEIELQELLDECDSTVNTYFYSYNPNLLMQRINALIYYGFNNKRNYFNHYNMNAYQAMLNIKNFFGDTISSNYLHNYIEIEGQAAHFTYDTETCITKFTKNTYVF